MFFNNYPYTDFHELNLDYILSKVKELDDKYNMVMSEALKELIFSKLNDLYIDVAYDESNRRLNLYLDTKLIADGEHIYTQNLETMEITG